MIELELPLWRGGYSAAARLATNEVSSGQSYGSFSATVFEVMFFFHQVNE